ncbi:MAG: S9 family peptidase [Bacteroidales bacterium]|nr:S9 family peptidase [Bacteroidales bacterium]
MKKLAALAAVAAMVLSVAFAQPVAQRTVLESIEEKDGKIMSVEEAMKISFSVASKTRKYISRPAVKSPYSEKGGSIYFNGECIQKGGGGIVYGQSVSRNEFNISHGLFVCPTPADTAFPMLAFYRKDESRVSDFPLLDINKCKLNSIKYPMNGQPSELVSVGVYNPKTGSTVYLKADDFDEERYLTNVTWGGDKYIYVQVLDRAQHNMHLNMYRASDGAFVKTILTESNDAWVEPYDYLYFPTSDPCTFIYSSDNRDGYKSLYLTDTSGVVRRIAPTDADIRFKTFKNGCLYYISAEISPAEQHLFRVPVSWKKGRTGAAKAKIGKPQRLTPEPGWHDITITEDGYVDTYSSFSTPRQATLYDYDGKLKEKICEPVNPLEGFAQCSVEFGTVPSADGKYQNHYRLFRPLNFDPSKKYPLILYVYGGPHSQGANASFMGGIRIWEMVMAQRGYVVYVQENRGTKYHGTDYEKAINRNCGKVEMEDQMVGVRSLMAEPWVDESRVGVHGWSYGGFMTLSLATTYPDVFKVAVAGGPVIDWRWYEIMYGERYMDTPATNAEGFESTSLINKATNLKAKTLIIQGAVDSTVVPHNALSFIQKCVDNAIPVDYFTFPKAPHNMTGTDRVYLYNILTDYFCKNL